MNCLCMHKMNKVWLLYYYVDCNYLKVATKALTKYAQPYWKMFC